MADNRMRDDDLQRDMGSQGREGQEGGYGGGGGQQSPGRNPQGGQQGSGQQGGQQGGKQGGMNRPDIEDDDEFGSGQNRGGQNR